ncbi:MAG: SLATT domain-containing protein [Nocardioidaceae bacterium]
MTSATASVCGKRSPKVTLRKFERVQAGLTVLVGAIALLAAALGTASLAPWIAVVTMVGTSVAVHVAASRYAFQRIEFLRSAGQLRTLCSEFQLASTTGARRSELVIMAEEVISVENKAWMAKLAEEPPVHGTGGKAG